MSHVNWYQNRRWHRRRAHQLWTQPLCEQCKARGRVEVATEVDHIRSHRGDRNAFWLGELQSLCKPCHDRKTRHERDAIAGRCDTGGTGVDGMPLNRNHWAWDERA